MTPLVEEYHHLLSIPIEWTQSAEPTFIHGFRDEFSHFQGLRRLVLGPGLNLVEGTCTSAYLTDLFGVSGSLYHTPNPSIASNNRWKTRRPWVFILCLFSTFLFPRANGAVDLSLMGIVLAVQRKRTIILMILAETYRALTRCSRGPSHFFTGVAMLLQFWGLHHLRSPHRMHPYYWFHTDLIEMINQDIRALAFPADLSDWTFQLSTATGEQLIWFIGWANPHCATIRGYQHPFLPLIGLNSVVPYAPSRVLRQLGRSQGIPFVGNMGVYSFNYSMDIDRSHALAARETWRGHHIFDSPGTTMDGVIWSTSYNYDHWLESVLAGRTMTQAVTLMGQEPLGALGYVDYVTEASLRIQRIEEAHLRDEQRLIAEIERLRAEVEAQRALTVQQAIATIAQESKTE
uniref:DUF7745 domain-containing protein n=1 Tax=Davidia involucrata TaxID=16924 RepID=A0A5B6YUQ2_DAVIN